MLPRLRLFFRSISELPFKSSGLQASGVKRDADDYLSGHPIDQGRCGASTHYFKDLNPLTSKASINQSYYELRHSSLTSAAGNHWQG